MAEEASVVRCDACPVLCRIREGKTGACDRYANYGGTLVRLDPLVVTERADAKTTLQEWAQGRGLEPPLYQEIERKGPDHAPEFTIAVHLDGYDKVLASGPSKKLAEHKAAEMFLIREKVWRDAI